MTDHPKRDEAHWLNIAALDALNDLSGARGVGDIAKLFRSEHPIDPVVRGRMADAIDEGRWKLSKPRAGAPVSFVERLRREQRKAEIGEYIIRKIAPDCPLKAALVDASQEFNVSEKTARTAYNWRIKGLDAVAIDNLRTGRIDPELLAMFRRGT